jgi:hypothetical protein
MTAPQCGPERRPAGVLTQTASTDESLDLRASDLSRAASDPPVAAAVPAGPDKGPRRRVRVRRPRHPRPLQFQYESLTASNRHVILPFSNSPTPRSL